MVGATLGTYRILSQIGEGGMGVVYLAEHTVIGRKVAIKVLRDDVARELVERFLIEARTAATLHHPGLVEVFDFGHAADRTYIVMEYLSGESLAQRLAHSRRLPIALACAIARQVASALHVAHEGGIVHRDLKPANIFVVDDPDSPDGVRTKVLDFGIAKLTKHRDERATPTHSGALIGTPRYMAPEQCKDARDVDGRADIYSLGCILFEMLLGVAPFGYTTWAELVAAHLHEQPPRPRDLDPSIPADLEQLIVNMLEKQPAHRPRSIREIVQAIDLFRSHAGSSQVELETVPLGGGPEPTRKAVSRAASFAPPPEHDPPLELDPEWVAERRAKQEAAAASPPRPPRQVAGVIVALTLIVVVALAVVWIAMRK